ncbi:MAG: 16S rRNA (cytosine(1402)-N(4))-methyltransferase [Flavobacteriales bacterium]|nr:16S rRNA (cytosine(1402)-N(4))-methyltransferase [Flavobacteriales bacterium]
MNKYHESVLLNDSIRGLKIKPEGIYVDVTFGGGGHSKEILKKLTTGSLIAFDQDQDSLINNIQEDNRFIMIHSNFRHIRLKLQQIGISMVDGIIADLGVSSHHFSDNGRGFSLKYDSIIDMRMDKKLQKDGRYILNTYNQQNLDRIFREHADFNNPRSISSAIIEARKIKEITTTFDFKKIFNSIVNKQYENKFFARLFQAVRIEVNDELNALKELLVQSKDILKPSGRLVVIAYHSLEDVLVKRFMKFGNFLNFQEKDFFGRAKSSFKVITKKPIIPSEFELKNNTKSRSAKLRICEKI